MNKFILKIKQLFCFHNWDVKRLDCQLIRPSIQGMRVVSTCKKCKRVRLLTPFDYNGILMEGGVE